MIVVPEIAVVGADGDGEVLEAHEVTPNANGHLPEVTCQQGHCWVKRCDLRRAEVPADPVAAVTGALGPVDLRVSNAGLGHRQTLEDVRSEDFDEMVAVTLRVPFLLAQQMVQGMRERRFGRILFVSSVAAFTGGIVGPRYAASKAGLHGLMHFLAARLAPCGVTVNSLAPASIAETGMLPGNPEELRQRIPVGRLGTPEEVADLALAVLRNPYLTNQVLSLDGGLYPR